MAARIGAHLVFVSYFFRLCVDGGVQLPLFGSDK